MKEVWVVSDGERAEGSTILGIFAEKRDALDYLLDMVVRENSKRRKGQFKYPAFQMSECTNTLVQYFCTEKVDYIEARMYKFNKRLEEVKFNDDKD